MQEVIQMCSFDANKSTKGASKLRRDLINGEIANLRDLLPLPSSTRQRLSQLQLMALVCVYVRKANYFQQVFKRHHELGHPYSTPNIGFSKALSGFLIMMTQNGKLLYISDNAAEYLGHSMEDLLIHGDSVYDIIDKADHGTVQTELLRSSNTQNPPGEETRIFLCRMNVSRNARRQMRFGDQKVVLLQGHFLSYLPLCSRNEPVFVATCTPVAMPETRECVVQGATNVFTSIHAMDMKFMHIDRNGEYYLGYTRSELGGLSWYHLIHWNYMREAQSKHRLISQSEQEKSCILLLRIQTRSGSWLWVHCVLQVKDGSDTQTQQQSVIVATNQVLSEREANVMRANSWLYHYYTVQTKLQYGLAYPETSGTSGSPTATAAAARLAAAAYFPNPQIMNYGSHQAHPHHLHHTHAPHHQISPDGGYPAMATPLHSPHNGGYTPAGHHFHHSFELGGKESPLDFSLGTTSVFDFPMGPGSYANPTSYWPHHHHPHGHGYPSQRHSDSSPSSSTGTVASPQNWALLSHTTHQHHQQTHNQQQQGSHHSRTTINSSTLSPSQSTSSNVILGVGGSVSGSSGGPGRKRLKKNPELLNEPPQSSSSQMASRPGFLVSHGIGGTGSLSGGGGGGGHESVATMSPYTFHGVRSRALYKMLGDVEEQAAGVKEEAMACPLTPSPIWEGQTQRVPDLQQFYGGEREGDGVMAGTDLIHCVPTYQPYLHFCSPGMGMSGVMGTGMAHHHGMLVVDSGSPNKENRLPPTPESDQGENDENRPIKWETL